MSRLVITVVLDIDGTLLDRNYRVNDLTLPVYLEKLQNIGMSEQRGVFMITHNAEEKVKLLAPKVSSKAYAAGVRQLLEQIESLVVGGKTNIMEKI